MHSKKHETTYEDNVPNPIMPKVSPLIRAAPEATSRICSTLCTLVPSRRAWCSQVVLLYRFRMWHMVESAVSSTEAAGTLHTAIPASRGRGCQLPTMFTFAHLTATQEHDVWNYRYFNLSCTKFLTVMAGRLPDIIVDNYEPTYFPDFFIMNYHAFIFCKLSQIVNRPLKPQKESTEDVW